MWYPQLKITMSIVHKLFTSSRFYNLKSMWYTMTWGRSFYKMQQEAMACAFCTPINPSRNSYQHAEDACLYKACDIQ